MEQQRKTVVLCIVTNNRHDVSLMCAVSMLRMQTQLMTHKEPLMADIHFVNTFDDALNVLLFHPKATGMLVLEGSMAMAPDFMLRAMASNQSVVAGTYPLPHIHWDRVVSQHQAGATEPIEQTGNLYNLTPLPGAVPDDNGYLDVGHDTKLGVAWIAKRAVEDIAKRHPEIMGTQTAALGCPGVYNGVRMDAYRRFLTLYGGRVLADTKVPLTSSGPCEFGGCVGSRAVLR